MGVPELKTDETNKNKAKTNPTRAFLGVLLIPLFHSTKCSITGHGRFSRTKALPSSSQTYKVPYVNVTESRMCPLLFQFTWYLCPQCAHFCFRSPGIFAWSVPTFVFGVIDEGSAKFSDIVFSRQHFPSFPPVCSLWILPSLRGTNLSFKEMSVFTVICHGLPAFLWDILMGSPPPHTHTHSRSLFVITFR